MSVFGVAMRRWAVPVLALLLGACQSTPDLSAWRATHEIPAGGTAQGSVANAMSSIDGLRVLDLAGARRLALSLVAAHPQEPRALFAASRAESDFVLRQPQPPEADRDMALFSALDYAERALAGDPQDPAILGQHAWALGATTHLQPMFSRAGHARRTEESCLQALEQDPDQQAALATLATLRLRLATLPWIAGVMAIGEPEGSLEEALELARRCRQLRPSREHCLLEARVLLAMEQWDEARAVLESAAAQSESHPRDQDLLIPIQAHLQDLQDLQPRP